MRYPPTPCIFASPEALAWLRKTLPAVVRSSLVGLWNVPDAVPLWETSSLPPRELLYFDAHGEAHRMRVPDQ